MTSHRQERTLFSPRSSISLKWSCWVSSFCVLFFEKAELIDRSSIVLEGSGDLQPHAVGSHAVHLHIAGSRESEPGRQLFGAVLRVYGLSNHRRCDHHSKTVPESYRCSFSLIDRQSIQVSRRYEAGVAHGRWKAPQPGDSQPREQRDRRGIHPLSLVQHHKRDSAQLAGVLDRREPHRR